MFKVFYKASDLLKLLCVSPILDFMAYNGRRWFRDRADQWQLA